MIYFRGSMFQNRGIKYFHLGWITISILFGLFVVYQINSETIYLDPVVITSGNPIEAIKACEQNCSVSGDLLPVSVPDFSNQLSGFDNFLPLSAISKFNMKINYSLEGNAFLEITYPKYSERIEDIDIICNDENSPKFSNKKPYKNIPSIRTIQITEKISEYFSCIKPNFNLSYSPNQKVEVGPNEYVKITTQNNDLIVKFDKISITLTPNWFTKLLVFLIPTFVSLGAGSILYLYLGRIGVFKEK